MGDFDVDFFHENLKQLIMSSKVRSIMREKHQLESLEEKIKYMRVFLKVTENKRNEHSEVMNLVRQIKDVVSETENIIELFVVQAFKTKHAPYFLRQHPDDISLDLESVKKNIKTLTAEIKQIFDQNMYDINGVASKKLEHSFFNSEGGSSSSGGSNASKVAEENVVVGFKKEVERLMGKLLDSGEGGRLEIISIVGAAGGGKTTLAREVYDHPLMSHTFAIRAWVHVSQDYDKTKKRNLLIRILELASPKKYGDYDKSSDEDKLGEDTLKCLKGKKYLIVMDDIWGIEPWNDIQKSLPRECKGSKVLFTSRQFVDLDSIRCFPHYLAPLSKSCSWELLQKKVFGNKCCPPELVGIGKYIVEKCEGLPLAIVAIAGILAVKDNTLDVWGQVSKHLNSIIAKNQEDCMEILELSYNHLPLHLKACFVYIGGFPEDSEILVRELIWLWIAEGFIQRREWGRSLEAVANDYLNSLIDRNLVMVASKRSFGGIKACRMHGLLRELCLKKAEEENFLVQIYGDDTLSPSAATKHRRLFIGSQFFHKFSLRPCTRNLHSFLFLSIENSPYSSFELNLSFFVENFEFLRVLSFISAECRGKIGRGHLVHLRYLALQLPNDASDFVSPFSYLFNLETLNLQAPSDDLDWKPILLPHDIFKMVKLRHLYAKRQVFKYHLHAGVGFDPSSKLDSLQTLHPICPCKECRNFLGRTPNLRKLGFFGDLRSNNFVLMLPNLEFLKRLETLSFVQRPIPNRTSTLWPELKFPPTVTRLTLKGARIMWEELSILQTMPSLEVLKLLEWACQGPIWNTSELEEGFSQLKYLRLQDLDIEDWNASEDQFPRLEVLVVKFCKNLTRIPIEFANLNELREIEIRRGGHTLEESAREILKEQRKLNHLATNIVFAESDDENMRDIKGLAGKKLEHSSSTTEGVSSSSRGSNTSNVAKENVVVGFKEEVKTLLGKLQDSGEGGRLEIISIIGPPGSGKTTLAKEVYDHSLTSHTFEFHAWVNVSQEYDKTKKRNLLIRILQLASPENHGDYKKSSEDKLGEDMHKFLKGKKYLIVMDDIWGTQAWNDIQRSLPKECNGSKVLFTSRQPVEPNSIHCVPHYMAPLQDSCNGVLLQKKAIMEDMFKTATLYYSKSSPDVKQAAHNFFNSLDDDNDGKVSLHEFLWFMRQEGHTKMSNRHFFKELDKDGSGNLEFMEVMALYYVIKSGRPFCSGCDEFIPGMYFACKKCFENGHNSFCVCPKCFEDELFVHEHVQFLDNYALFEARRLQGIATYSNQHKPSSSVTITELGPTSTTNAVALYEPKAAIMEDLVKTAGLYYRKSSPEVKEAAQNFFNSLDDNKDGKVSFNEFLRLMRQEGHTKMSNRHFFKELDKDGSGTLEFMEVMALFYAIKSGRPFCSWCDEFIPGIYFTCSKCFGNGDNSFCVCPKCFEDELLVHEHDQFLDNYALLEAKRLEGIANHSNQHKPSSSVTITELDLTSTANAVALYQRPRPQWGHLAYTATEIGLNAVSVSLNAFNAVLNASSWLNCTIM